MFLVLSIMTEKPLFRPVNDESHETTQRSPATLRFVEKCLHTVGEKERPRVMHLFVTQSAVHSTRNLPKLKVAVFFWLMKATLLAPWLVLSTSVAAFRSSTICLLLRLSPW